MSTLVNVPAVRDRLASAREVHARVEAASAERADTIYFVGACAGCGTLATAVWSTSDSATREAGSPCRRASEVRRVLGSAFAEAPRVRVAGEDKNATQCACGRDVFDRRIVGVRWLRTLAGTGAECIVEGTALSNAVDEIASVPTLEAFRWRLLRGVRDGGETDVGAAFDDDAFREAFGRDLTLTHTWSRLFERARAPGGAVIQIEDGLWIFAGPRGDDALTGAINGLLAERSSRAAYPIADLAKYVPLPPGPSWTEGLGDHAGWSREFEAGVIIDHDVTRRGLRLALRRSASDVSPSDDGSVIARRGEVAWPIDPRRVALGGVHIGLTLSESLAMAAREAIVRLDTIERWLKSARAARPDVVFVVRGTLAHPVRRDRTVGRPLDLSTLPFVVPPATLDFDREMRFACDDVPPWADASRVCSCGATATIAARIVPWTMVVASVREGEGGAPRVLRKLPDESVRAAIAVAAGCDRHTWLPSESELARWGLDDDALGRRIAEDLRRAQYFVDVSLCESASGHRALAVRGPFAASAVLDEHWIASLHEATESRLRGRFAIAVVVTPSAFLLAEESFDAGVLDELATNAGLREGVPEPIARSPLLRARVTLDALPSGRFVALSAA
jgi:hypothetical protein